MSAGNLATDATVYSEYTQSVILEKDDVVEIILSNQDSGTHPFHLHGYAFQLLGRFPSYGENFYDYDAGTEFATFDPSNHTELPVYPAAHNTFVLPPGDTMSSASSLTTPAPRELQDNLVIPDDHIKVCEAVGVPYEGNAAANTEDYLNMKGENKPPGFIPEGFTAHGIVALVTCQVNQQERVHSN
ncbi:Multicopper oxidase type 2 [Penicillium samsonianum]|uniref:Multicopper oxidase type 2 n=1 Tax=Penicillium samsonianum TaxID=1882272 RepID=UPI002548DF8A|nr:Multicopper oxidase type 2 [Penicillium samsonianum]KAJ6123678.1 Multicopper oxidase type 2 [Penicillium samsonianum]